MKKYEAGYKFVDLLNSPYNPSKVTVSRDGVPIVADSFGRVFKSIGTDWYQIFSSIMTIDAIDIGAGKDGSIWALNSYGEAYQITEENQIERVYMKSAH